MFLRIELGPSRGHFSLENGLSDTWFAKFSRCAHLRTWGSAPQIRRPLLERPPRHSGGGVATQCRLIGAPGALKRQKNVLFLFST